MQKHTQKITSYKDLTVWQQAMELAQKIYQLTKHFPDEERFGLVSQLRRAAVSVPSNIAEGRSRTSRKDFVQFLHIALGSLSELETQLEIARRVLHIREVEYNEVTQLAERIKMMLFRLIAALKAKTEKR